MKHSLCAAKQAGLSASLRALGSIMCVMWRQWAAAAVRFLKAKFLHILGQPAVSY
jgi:hypothetical protein